MHSPKAIINLNNLKSNIEYLKKISNDSKLFPVIKANGYGHGLIEIGKFLSTNHIQCVCVATYSEIYRLLEAKVDIDVLHLGQIFYDNFDIYFKKNVILTINSIQDVKKIISFTKKDNKPIRCHIKIDTGMNRMGCKESDFPQIYSDVSNYKLLHLEGVYSHLACSSNLDASSNSSQFNKFEKAISFMKNDKVDFHILNSGGLFNYREFSYNIIRPGISIYGISPIDINDKLKPVMEFKAPVILCKKIYKGETVGYNCTYKAQDNMNIAILQCGYADGLNKNFERNSFVFYKNLKFPIIGKISMDLFAIDCKNFNFRINDEVTIWGGECNASRLEEISKKHDVIPYVYLTNLSNRVERVYIEK